MIVFISMQIFKDGGTTFHAGMGCGLRYIMAHLEYGKNVV